MNLKFLGIDLGRFFRKEIPQKEEENAKTEPTPSEEVPLIQKLIYNANEEFLTVMFSDGDIISGSAPKDSLDLVRNAKSKKDVIDMLSKRRNEEPVKSDKEDNMYEMFKQRVKASVHVLSGSKDFDVYGDKVFFKGISTIAIPEVVVGAFIEMIERLKNGFIPVWETEEYQSLKAFTYWLLLNPIESSRNDCLDFVRKNDIKITKNGLLVCYRRIVSTDKTADTELTKFISESHFKVKTWKKSAKNYTIVKRSGQLKLTTLALPSDEMLGNLEDLYKNLSDLEGNTYTDAHTKRKTIKVGQIYYEDEDKIDLNNQRDCSAGLHVGSKAFGFSGFGDVGVMALVNPSKVRSVPVSDAHKMRVSEMFIACIMEKDGYDEVIADDKILDYSEEYYNATTAEMEELLKQKDFAAFTCQDNSPALSIKDIGSVVNHLKNRIVTV